MDDQKIVTMYWQRDERAIAVTQEKYGRYLYKIAWNVLSDSQDCDESLNDTYLAAWNSMPPHRPAALQTYLGKLARRISIDILRRQTRVKRGGTEYTLSLSELEGCVAGGMEPEEDLENKRLGQSLNDFVRGLTEQERSLFIGRYYFMDPLKDVAAYCGMGQSKAKSMLFRIRNRLREYLIKEGFEL